MVVGRRVFLVAPLVFTLTLDPPPKPRQNDTSPPSRSLSPGALARRWVWERGREAGSVGLVFRQAQPPSSPVFFSLLPELAH